MHPVFFVIILFSFLVSSLIYFWVIKTKANKWVRISFAFLVNGLILSIAAVFLYKMDVHTFHKQTNGLFDNLGIGTLLFYIPINTLLNIHIMEFVKNKDQRIVDR